MDESMETNMTESESTPTEVATEQADTGEATSGAEESGSHFTDGGTSETEVGGEGSPSATDTDGGTEKEGSAKEDAGKGDANARAARRRREAERAAELERVREEVRRQTILETLGSVNPFTGEAMADQSDVDEFLEMQEIKRRGGDPVADYARYHKEIARETAAREAEEATKREQRQRLVDDRQRFIEAHPDVELGKLLADKDFLDYAHGRLGTVSLSELYEGYESRRADEEARIEARAREMAAQMLANSQASPGSAVGTGGTPEVFTPERVRAMSREEVRASYDKIVASMNYWK